MNDKIESKMYSYIRQNITKVYDGYGYDEIYIPLFVSCELYKQFNGVPYKRLVKMIDRDGEVRAIRPDATFHVLNKVAKYDLHDTNKFYYITDVVRYNEKKKVNAVTMQTGVEFFNDPSPVCDSEVVAIAIESLLKTGITDIRVDLGHSDFLLALFSNVELLDKADVTIIHKYIADKNVVDLQEYLQAKNVDEKIVSIAVQICMLFGDYDSIIKKARTLCINDEMEKALDNLAEIYDGLTHYGYDKYIFLDLGFANVMEYYSGMIFKVYCTGAYEEVISGGRYDHIAKKLGNMEYACGFGHTIDLSLPIIEKLDIDFKETITVYCTKETYAKGVEVCVGLRNKGYSVNLVGNSDSFKIVHKDIDITKQINSSERISEND